MILKETGFHGKFIWFFNVLLKEGIHMSASAVSTLLLFENGVRARGYNCAKSFRLVLFYAFFDGFK